METISCHRNQNLYQTITKKNKCLFPLPVDAICAIWKELTSWLQRCRLKMLIDVGRTLDVSIYYKLTSLEGTLFKETF